MERGSGEPDEQPYSEWLYRMPLLYAMSRGRGYSRYIPCMEHLPYVPELSYGKLVVGA